MKKGFLQCALIVSSAWLVACASGPESHSVRGPAGEWETQMTGELETQRLQKMGLYAQSEVAQPRVLEQDCLLYKEPTLYSQRLQQISGGRELWTEDTGLAWYKVSNETNVGYLSKICFKN